MPARVNRDTFVRVGSTSSVSGRPWYGQRADVPQSVGVSNGCSASISTPATSIDFVEPGVSRSPRMHREYRSIAIVRSADTHFPVTGATANTFSGVVSISTYSPGRTADNRP